MYIYMYIYIYIHIIYIYMYMRQRNRKIKLCLIIIWINHIVLDVVIILGEKCSRKYKWLISNSHGQNM